MSILRKILFLSFVLFAAGCMQKSCEEYPLEECPIHCELCRDAAYNGSLKCHSRNYCGSAITCLNHSEKDCPEGCLVCPACSTCSATMCRPKEYCESIGFNESWYEGIKERLEVYCHGDEDCACGVHIETRECFTGNKKYVDVLEQCPDFCTGIAGHLETKCVNNTCKQVLR